MLQTLNVSQHLPAMTLRCEPKTNGSLEGELIGQVPDTGTRSTLPPPYTRGA
jgi:hypothetical protein